MPAAFKFGDQESKAFTNEGFRVFDIIDIDLGNRTERAQIGHLYFESTFNGPRNASLNRMFISKCLPQLINPVHAPGVSGAEHQRTRAFVPAANDDLDGIPDLYGEVALIIGQFFPLRNSFSFGAKVDKNIVTLDRHHGTGDPVTLAVFRCLQKVSLFSSYTGFKAWPYW